MVKELQDNGFVQLCDCGAEHTHLYDNLELMPENPRMIKLPQCSVCKQRIEFLIHTGFAQPNEYSRKVVQIFAEVAIRHA